VPVVIHGKKGTVKTYCMLDWGATRCVVHEDVVRELDLPLEKRNTRVTTIDSIKEGSRNVSSFRLTNLEGNYDFPVSRALVSDILTLEGDVPPTQNDIKGYSHLEGVELPDELPDKKVGLILSADYAWGWLGGDCRRGARDEPVCFLTCFGWACVGHNRSSTSDIVSHFRIDADDLELKEDLNKVFGRDFEDIAVNKKCPSVRDLHALKQLRDSARFDDDLHHWKVGLPWATSREDAAKILNSVDSSTPSLNRLIKSTERLRRDPVLKEKVMKQMNSLISGGQIKKVDPKMEQRDGIPYWVMPTLFVTRPDKPGKVRVCQDAKAKVKGVSLNDNLLTGPDLANSLLGILFRFRRHKVVVSADIKEFYHNVFVDDDDVQVNRFWWYEDEEMTKKALFEVRVHIMGETSSATVAAFTLQNHAESIRGSAPIEVIEQILKSFYVDDFLSSFPNVETARKMRTDLTAALKRGGLDLCKWKSTHEEVLLDDEKGQDAEKVFKEFDDDILEKVLGVAYTFKKDFLSFKVKEGAADGEIKSRRMLLSTLAKCYDPLGVVAPFTILGKMLFQEAINEEGGWDTPLSEDLKKRANAWRLGISDLLEIRVRRWVANDDTTDSVPDLHIFSDASKVGYGFCVYRRAVNETTGEVSVANMYSKARIIPKVKNVKTKARHHESIPRFELTAAAAAAEFFESFKPEAGEEFGKVFFWTDSTCVLAQIRDEKSRFDTFVSNRKSKINSSTEVDSWRWISTDQNPADMLSRGMLPGDKKWEMFHYGPEFLYHDESTWCNSPEPVIEAAIGALNVVFEEPSQAVVDCTELRLVDKLSSWQRKVERIAYGRIGAEKFLKWRSNGEYQKVDHLTILQVNLAEESLIRAIQRKHFSKEMDELSSLGIKGPNQFCKDLKLNNSPLRKLNPYMDEKGILRMGSRLFYASSLSWDTRCPIILPKKDSNVEALIRQKHKMEKHAGTDHIFNLLRREYHIINGRQSIRKVVSSCLFCQKAFKKPVDANRMGPLPSVRVEEGPPFDAVGVDLFGNFEVTRGGRPHHKIWVVIFTCLKSRAVHFECVFDLSVSSFIMALQRVSSRRGGIRSLYSDNASNLRGSDAELKRAMEVWNDSKAADEFRSVGVSWTYNAPLASHRSGVFERLIRSSRHFLHEILSKDSIDETVFNTTLIVVEGILNRRPITHVSSDEKDIDALSPSDLLYPGTRAHSSINIVPPSTVSGEEFEKGWKKARGLTQLFWKKWSSSYLNSLKERQKWNNSMNNLQRDQIVLMVDEGQPRDCWRIARVTDVRGEGDHIRTALVKLPNGKVFERDVTKLVYLELDN